MFNINCGEFGLWSWYGCGVAPLLWGILRGFVFCLFASFSLLLWHCFTWHTFVNPPPHPTPRHLSDVRALHNQTTVSKTAIMNMILNLKQYCLSSVVPSKHAGSDSHPVRIGPGSSSQKRAG